jgi:hypothetical protein
MPLQISIRFPIVLVAEIFRLSMTLIPKSL